MQAELMDLLECPLCRSELTWDIHNGSGEYIEQGQACCTGCGAIYPIKDGIGVFLVPELQRNDLWAQIENEILTYLETHPDQESKLMDTPVEDLSPTDQQLRAQVLDGRGDFGGAKTAEGIAHSNLYTPDHLRCWSRQMTCVLDHLESLEGIVVDIASGRGYLAEKILEREKRHVVISDFSLNVLRRNRDYFDFLGYYDWVSLLAFDARQTPFIEGSVTILTTNLGLPNIEYPGKLLSELKRFTRGVFLAISHFFPDDDEANRAAIEKAGLAPLLYEQTTLEAFRMAGWNVKLDNPCTGKSMPSPESAIFPGVRADGLPVAPTELKWCVIRAQ